METSNDVDFMTFMLPFDQEFDLDLSMAPPMDPFSIPLDPIFLGDNAVPHEPTLASGHRDDALTLSSFSPSHQGINSRCHLLQADVAVPSLPILWDGLTPASSMVHPSFASPLPFAKSPVPQSAPTASQEEIIPILGKRRRRVSETYPDISHVSKRKLPITRESKVVPDDAETIRCLYGGCGRTVTATEIGRHVCNEHVPPPRPSHVRCGWEGCPDPARLRRLDGLRKHIEAHAQLRVKCPLCNKKFSRTDSCKRHVDLEHKEDVAEADHSDHRRKRQRRA
ncbi:uncharacterized protein FIBRA_03315 [Fibroporia radiculosa]|uniref:C2H2-type domain-containing protein n=1 Tax=Fibroporia radiculosa TaxID=599839 RepID=J4I9J4_9APHY|nr:uncharacterized protein FIBRA_03315 [Fibroporia radiculosa]CCM01266.1 predicted protein [Fibroporia radiculosa]